MHSRRGKGTIIVLLVPDDRMPVEAATERVGPGTQLATMPAGASVDVSATRSHTPIHVLLADDHAVVRDSLARLLQMQPDIVVIGQAADGQQAVDMALQLRPDVVLMDVSMPRLNGIEATRYIVSQLPQIRVVGLSMHSNESVATAMVDAGAVGNVCKTAAVESLMAVIRVAVERIAK